MKVSGHWMNEINGHSLSCSIIANDLKMISDTQADKIKDSFNFQPLLGIDFSCRRGARNLPR
jgi:hypothetical protein